MKSNEPYWNDEKRKEFHEASKPLLDFLNKYGNPYMKIIIEPMSVEIVSGEMIIHDDSFIRGRYVEI